ANRGAPQPHRLGAQHPAATAGNSLKAFWYHFAIMFEALFILTTIDAGTRVARFMVSDALGNLPGAKKFKDPSWWPGVFICSAVVVGLWGSVLLMGVTDPLGGINTLYPLFGISNQLLAAIALTVVLVIVVKKGLLKWAWIPAVPLVWDLIVTMTASWQKIFSGDKNIGYWTQHHNFTVARDAGKVVAPAKNMDDMNKVVHNTFIQGTLSIVFAALVLIVALVALWVIVKAIRAGGGETTESPEVPSKIFGPSGFLATKAEKEVQQEWDTLITDGKIPVPGAATVGSH
ncbi:carbon starvation CstA family protein, partial [Nocardia niigatensis]